MSGLSKFRETFHHSRPHRRRSLSPTVDGLDQRALLSAGFGYAPAGHVAEVSHERDSEHNGTVVQSPMFYEDYVGPRLTQLNAVAATGELRRNGSFLFRGVNQGVIDPNRACNVCLRGRPQRSTSQRTIPRPKPTSEISTPRSDHQDRARPVANRHGDRSGE